MIERRTFAETDPRDHVLYDYVIDCPERVLAPQGCVNPRHVSWKTPSENRGYHSSRTHPQWLV